MDLDWISSDSKFSSLSNFVVALAFAIFDEQRYIYIYIYIYIYVSKKLV